MSMTAVNIDLIEKKENKIVNFADYAKEESEFSYYLKTIGNYPLYTTEEEIEAFKRYKSNPTIELRDEIFKRNCKLVISVAKKYMNQVNSMTFMDLISEGNMGLLKAINLFDVDLGNKFSTYATWWIRQGITRAIALQENGIRVPVHAYDKILNIKKVYAEYYMINEEEPTSDYIAKKLKISKKEADFYIQVYQDIFSISSLNKEIGESEHGEISELEDFIADDSLSVEELAEETDIKDIVSKLIGEYIETKCRTEDTKYRTREIIERRFALGRYDSPDTLEEIGKDFGITRERVRQIEANFIKWMSHPIRKRKLKEYL